jgi:ER degradation enhancer, mannosidase alpha-like 2
MFKKAIWLLACLAATVLPAYAGDAAPPDRPLHAVPGLTPDPELAAEARAAFQHAWSHYEAFAWGHDALRPLSRSSHDWYGVSLLMTPVDAYDTMLLMGLTDEAARAKELVLANLRFDHDVVVQVFEVDIRLLGGLLSAYQLDDDPRWLALAVDLADRLLPAFASPTGMPYVKVNLATGRAEQPRNNPAEIGTLTLEFAQLSRLTGDPRYGAAVKKAVTALFARRSALGLVGEEIDVETGAWLNPASHVGGMIDSYYEYLLKAWLLTGDDDYRAMWEASRDAINRYVADEPAGRGLWYGGVDMNTGVRTDTTFGALQAFLPAVLALGGDLDRAGRLMLSVQAMWTRCGVEPEVYDYVKGEVVHGGYPLRPEALESAYYLFALTGDETYRQMGRDFFHRLVAATRVEAGFAALQDVRTGKLKDSMESFFLAETLKYAYLLARPDAVDFDRIVFNTEAHPLKVNR